VTRLGSWPDAFPRPVDSFFRPSAPDLDIRQNRRSVGVHETSTRGVSYG